MTRFSSCAGFTRGFLLKPCRHHGNTFKVDFAGAQTRLKRQAFAKLSRPDVSRGGPEDLVSPYPLDLLRSQELWARRSLRVAHCRIKITGATVSAVQCEVRGSMAPTSDFRLLGPWEAAGKHCNCWAMLGPPCQDNIANRQDARRP